MYSLPDAFYMSQNLRLIGQRLKEYMQTRSLSITSVARVTNFSVKELDAMVNGGIYPLTHLMLLLALFDDVNPRWLLTGEAPMLLKGTPKPKRESIEDIEARETLRRRSLVPLKADPGLSQRVAALEIELLELRGLVAAVAERLAGLGE